MNRSNKKLQIMTYWFENWPQTHKARGDQRGRLLQTGRWQV